MATLRLDGERLKDGHLAMQWKVQRCLSGEPFLYFVQDIVYFEYRWELSTLSNLCPWNERSLAVIKKHRY